MKTMKEWRRGLFACVNLKNFSSFFEVAFAIATIGLLPMCLSASEYWAEYYTSIVVLSFLVVAVIAWLVRAENKKESQDLQIASKI